MNAGSAIRLVMLAAIWGASFLFMRISSPILGAPAVAELRVFLAGLFLLGVAVIIRRKLELIKYWQHYCIVGLLNSALPFLLFSYAAIQLQASLLSILNATAPIWGSVFTAIMTRQLLPMKTVVGLTMGVMGVVTILGLDVGALPDDALWPCLAAIGAAFCYGLASTYARYAQQIDPYNNAHGTMWASAVMLLPLAFAFAPRSYNASTLFDTSLISAVLSLGFVCTGVAYLLYFRLIKDVGPASALTVTFLIPFFGVLWGSIFLDEDVGWSVLVGGALVVLGTMLVMGFSLRSLFYRDKSHV